MENMSSLKKIPMLLFFLSLMGGPIFAQQPAATPDKQADKPSQEATAKPQITDQEAFLTPCA
jgi:hypothetical protein